MLIVFPPTSALSVVSMFISWMYATLNFYLLDVIKNFQTNTVSTSPAAGALAVFLIPKSLK
jgi:hypothetical protein